MNSQSKKMELLGSASIPKALLAMGIPTMIGMLVNAFIILWMLILSVGWERARWEQSP